MCKALRVDLEIAHFAAARGGRPVSTVEFRALPRDVLERILHFVDGGRRPHRHPPLLSSDGTAGE